MTPFMWIAIGMFLLTDLLVVAMVVQRIHPRLLRLMLPGGDRDALFASVHAMVGDHLRANYSGDPQQLPTAIGGLLPGVRDMLMSRGIEPRPEVVRALIEASAIRHRIATPRQLREALATTG